MSDLPYKKLPLDTLIYSAFFVVLVVSIFFRSYNLTWGAPFFFHPDERNVAVSISQIKYPQQMNPHFFAYGSLPIYSIYFTGTTVNFINNLVSNDKKDLANVGFEQSIIIGRGYSFLFSILIIFLIYSLGKDLSGKKAGIIGATLASLSVGFIQYSHFATFEMWLSFFTLLLCYLIIKYAKNYSLFYLLLIGGIIGILVSIKISSLVLLPISLIVIIIFDFKKILRFKKNRILEIEKSILKVLLIIAIATLVTYLSNPYFWLDTEGFFGGINYESRVGLGILPVFYTEGFMNSLPILYQFVKVYPFVLNPILSISLVYIFFIFYKIFRQTNSFSLFIIFAFLGVTFFSQAFLYVKWIRYYIPTLPFIYIICGISISYLLSKRQKKSTKKLFLTAFLTIIFASFIYSFAYFKTVLLDKDTRVLAADWASKNISEDSEILSEVYDLGIIPFNPHFSSITLFNFYELDSNPSKEIDLSNLLKLTKYVVLPSQRILEVRIKNPSDFPKGHDFYQKLVNQKGGFKKVYSTPCDIFCKILYLGSPSFSYEQTANVFDRPEVNIFINENANNYKTKK